MTNIMNCIVLVQVLPGSPLDCLLDTIGSLKYGHIKKMMGGVKIETIFHYDVMSLPAVEGKRY